MVRAIRLILMAVALVLMFVDMGDLSLVLLWAVTILYQIELDDDKKNNHETP